MNLQIKMENKPCPLGCKENDELILTGWDRFHKLPGKFTVVKCKNCGLMRTNPRPTADTIGFYYPEDYGPYKGTQVFSSFSSVSQSYGKQVAKKILNTYSKHIPNLAPGKMLEIGCASGSFLHKMAGLGWEVDGIEFSEKAAQSALKLGHQVYIGSVENAPNPEKKYDLIVGWMVLEHLHDPILCLKKLSRWLSPGGCLVLSVPNANSLEFKIFQNAWYALHLPNHLYHYTPQSLSHVLEHCGWKTERIFHQRVSNNLVASLGYFLEDRKYNNIITQNLIDFPKKAGYKHYLLYPLSYVLSLFGQTGRMTIWASKIND